MARLQAEVDGQRSAQSSVTLGHTLDEWLKTAEVEDSTRDGYIGYVERDVPRDRECTFEPQIVKKRQRRLTDVDEICEPVIDVFAITFSDRWPGAETY